MKISVIIPVYNVEPFLPACLDSVLAQTHRDLEIILVDDGSADSSGAICDRYAGMDPRIRVIHQENGGVSLARNRGLELATGEVISFIDSDDTLEPDMYEQLVHHMQTHGADISHCGYKHLVRDEVRLINDTKQIRPQTREEALECLLSGRLFSGSLCCKLFRRELLEGLSFREELKNNEDILLCFEIFNRSRRSVFADFPLYNYYARLGTSAVFTLPSQKKLQDSCLVSRLIYETLRNTPLHDTAAARYIRSLRAYYQYCVQNEPDKCSNIRSDLIRIARESGRLDWKLTIAVNLIRYCPWMFRLVYSVYDKFRRPQYEVRKEG